MMHTIMLASALVAASGSLQELQQQTEQVESLARKLRTARRTHDDELRALRLRKAQLEASIAAERARGRALQSEASARQEDLEALSQTEEHLKPMALTALETARQHVMQTIPFRRRERLARLDKLQAQLDEKDAASAVLLEVIAFLENEKALTKEVSAHRGVLTMHGDDVLVDMARLGMAVLYYRDPQGELGYVAPDGTITPLTSVHEREGVSTLFKALAQRHHAGAVGLPLPPLSTGGSL